MKTSLNPALRKNCVVLLLAALATSAPNVSWSDPVKIRQNTNSSHGFLVVRNQAGTPIGSGELFQAPHKGHMLVRLILRFKDGSIDDESTEFSQDRVFRLISDRHIQRGPFFAHPLDTSIDLPSQQIKIVPLDKGPGSSSSEHMDLPADLANGILLALITNFKNDGKETRISYLGFAPKKRLVKLVITNVGQQSFKIAGHAFAANHFAIKIDLGGIVGIVAPILGKQPPDIEVWTSAGKIPTIVRVDGALSLDGPIVSLQPASPIW